ncbi:MAG: hypothetical protein ACT4N5_03015 [Nitrosopumilaceae archaeon]
MLATEEIKKLPSWMRLDKDIKMLEKMRKHLVLEREATNDHKVIDRCAKRILQLEKTIKKLERTWERMTNI